MAVHTADGVRLEASPRYKPYFFVAAILLLFGSTVALVQYKVPTIMPAITTEYRMTPGAASWLMSIFTFVGIFLALPTGALSKRFGPKNMLLAAAGLVVIGSLIGAFTGSGTMLIVSRAIEGIAFIFVTTCGPLAVRKYVAPEKVGSALGIWALWVSVGSVLGGIITPSIYGASGLRGVWLIYAGFCVLAALLVVALISRPGGAAAEQAEAVEEASPGWGGLFRKDPLLLLFGWATFNTTLLACLAFSPTWMQQNNINPTLSGFISTLPMLLCVISSPLFGGLSDKTGKPKPLLLLAMVSMGPCAFLLLTQTGPLLWLGAILMGLLGMGAPVMALTAYPAILKDPALLSIGMGFLMLIQSLGQFLGSWLTPLLLGPQLTQWYTAGIVMLVIGLVGTAAVALVKFD